MTISNQSNITVENLNAVINKTDRRPSNGVYFQLLNNLIKLICLFIYVPTQQSKANYKINITKEGIKIRIQVQK